MFISKFFILGGNCQYRSGHPIVFHFGKVLLVNMGVFIPLNLSVGDVVSQFGCVHPHRIISGDGVRRVVLVSIGVFIP